MREMKIAITALYRPEEYVLHLRKGDKRRGTVGLAGFFGGQKKDNETYRKAAARGLSEETNLDLPLEKFEPMSGVYKVISDRDGKPIIIWSKLFRVLLPYGTHIEVTDQANDELMAAATPDIAQNYIDKGKLTPATERGFKEYLFTGLVMKGDSSGVIDN